MICEIERRESEEYPIDALTKSTIEEDKSWNPGIVPLIYYND